MPCHAMPTPSLSSAARLVFAVLAAAARAFAAGFAHCGLCGRSRQAAVERYGQPSSSAVQDRQSESAPCGSVANHAARPLLARAMRCADAISLRCGPMRCDAVRCGAVRRYTPTAETRAAASQPHLAVSHPPFEARRGPPVVPRPCRAPSNAYQRHLTGVSKSGFSCVGTARQRAIACQTCHRMRARR